MNSVVISEGQTFYAPRFVIQVDGQDVDPTTVRDVLEVTYADSLSEMEYFEFTLNDWDPVSNQPKYSSPYDEDQKRQQDRQGNPIPAFEPGQTVSLAMGYYGPEELVPKLTGTIVSITPTFPANGIPVMTVRVLSSLFELQSTQITREFEGQKDTAIAQSLSEDLGLGVATVAGQEQRETENEFLMLNNEYPINFLLRRARLLGYDLMILETVDPALGLTVTGESDDGRVLFFGPSNPEQPTYGLAWGKTLTSFNIAVRIREQVGSVTVKATNPAASGNAAEITATAALADLDLDLPDSKLLDAISAATDKTEEIVVDEPVQTQAEADTKALGILQERVKDMITAEGGTIGFPHLRAGRLIEVTGIGPRYAGRWLLVKTTHKIDSTGYTTTFSCRLEGSLP